MKWLILDDSGLLMMEMRILHKLGNLAVVTPVVFHPWDCQAVRG